MEDKNPEEIVLYQDSDREEEERIENSQSDIEHISDEDFMMDCSRYGDTQELIDLFKEVPNININYKDFRGNTALRNIFCNNMFRYG